MSISIFSAATPATALATPRRNFCRTPSNGCGKGMRPRRASDWPPLIGQTATRLHQDTQHESPHVVASFRIFRGLERRPIVHFRVHVGSSDAFAGAHDRGTGGIGLAANKNG